MKNKSKEQTSSDIDEVSSNVNKFIFKEMKKTENIDEALILAGCIGAALFRLYETLLDQETTRKIFSEMSKTNLSKKPPTMH